jgi:uncharacterized protein (TIGR02145 family)
VAAEKNQQTEVLMKTRSFLLAAGFVLAMAFTLSCSGDDGGEDGGSSSSTEGGEQGGGSSSSGGRGDDGSVAYEGQTYKIVKIGTQTWFAENLNYAVAGSKCYGEGGLVYDYYDEENGNWIKKTLSAAEVQANCVKYGRLYDWSTAMALPSSCNDNFCLGQIQTKQRGICPSGWHIPSNDDWDKLYRYADGTSGTESPYPYHSPTAGKHLKAQSGWESEFGIENLDTWDFSALPGGSGNSNGSFERVGNYGGWWSASEERGYSDGAFTRDMHYNIDEANSYGDDKFDLYSVRCLQD